MTRRYSVRVFKRQYSSGKKSWGIDWEDAKGRRRKRMIGSKQAAVLASEELEKRIVLEEAGVRRKKQRPVVTLRQFWEGDWKSVMESRQLAASTQERYLCTFKALDRCGLGDKPLSAINERDIMEFTRGRLRAGLTSSGINKDLRNFESILNAARKLKLIKELPAIDKLKETERQPRMLSFAEIERLLAAAKDVQSEISHSGGAAIYPIVAVAAFTGLRKGSILHLKLRDIDFEREMITVTAESTKQRRETRVPMIDRLRDILSDHLRGKTIGPDDRIFATDDCEKTFRSAVKRAGLVFGQRVADGITFHSLRHAFAQVLADAEMDARDIAQIMDHSTMRMAMKYQRIGMPKKRDLMERAFEPGKVIPFESRERSGNA